MSSVLAVHENATSASTWHWVLFGGFMATLLILDLFVLNRRHRVLTTRQALAQTLLWITMAAVVLGFIISQFGLDAGSEYATAYVIEWTLSVDNLFVISIVLGAFWVPPAYRHTVLFWGIFGALFMRLGFVLLGIEAIEKFDFAIPLFGVFLLFTACKLLLSNKKIEVENMRSYRFFLRVLPMTSEYHGSSFIIRKAGKILVTPLMVCLSVIESVDLLFAVDSVPAVLAVTQDPFLAFTSNAMAVLGLRSLYFLLEAFRERLTRLETGIIFILAFIGIKMLLSSHWLFLPGVHIPTMASLGFIFTAIGLSAWASFMWPKKAE